MSQIPVLSPPPPESSQYIKLKELLNQCKNWYIDEDDELKVHKVNAFLIKLIKILIEDNK